MWVDRRKPTPYEGELWGFDNGAYHYFLHGQLLDENVFLKRLDLAYQLDIPYIAITPDIVCGGLKSLEYSLSWLERLPGDWPWYLAVQDGMTVADVEPVVYSFAGIFLGGSTGFKSTAPIWRELAHRCGKNFHYGRAGTKRKLLHAMDCGADSADSAFPLWTRERFNEFVKWWEISRSGILRLWPPGDCLGI